MRKLLIATALGVVFLAACSSGGEGPASPAPDALLRGIVPPVVAPLVPGGPPVQDATLAGARAALPQPPTSLSIGALSLSMPVDPVGLAADGTMALPGSALTAGWYQNGAVPGAAEGNIVIAAHVDDAEVGLGPFAGLRKLEIGEEVRLADATGREFVYRVTSVEQTDKSQVDPNVLFAGNVAPRLALVTCGGTWDAKIGHYQDNVIVWAELTEQPS